MDRIYLDYSSTTPLLPEALEAMRPFLFDHFGNPASSHGAGREARKALEDARERVAHLLDAHPEEVLFTSGATEANNLALFGLVGPSPGQIISSPIEHPCVSEPLQQLAARGWTVTQLPVNRDGVVGVEVLDIVTRPELQLVTVMLANHETGAGQPVCALVEKLDGKTPFHCDAAAAVGKMPVSFRSLGVTSLTVSAHKFHGPKGIGALIVQKHSKLRPLFFGGHQQQGKRPGTEPVALVVGMAAALEPAVRNLEANWQKVLRLRTSFFEALRSHAAPIAVNGPFEGGPFEGGLPYTLNISFPGCQADVLLMALDLEGVACSTGSACSSGSLLPSPVLRAMGVPPEVLQSAMRFSFSAILSENDVLEAASRVSAVVRRLRAEVE
ncbi:MAG: cysteine desulfurase [Gemmataceae bacterium]|nr:cysteine desulfurase [Gemmataceae bacterium]